jgi:hypothetical protein
MGHAATALAHGHGEVVATAQPTPGRQHPQAESEARPLRRRADRIARPARVRIRSRKPCVFARRRLFGWNVRLLTTLSPYDNSPRQPVAATASSDPGSGLDGCSRRGDRAITAASDPQPYGRARGRVKPLADVAPGVRATRRTGRGFVENRLKAGRHGRYGQHLPQVSSTDLCRRLVRRRRTPGPSTCCGHPCGELGARLMYRPTPPGSLCDRPRTRSGRDLGTGNRRAG